MYTRIFRYRKQFDRLDEDASPDPWSRWLIGCGLAAVPTIIGVIAAWREQAYFLKGVGAYRTTVALYTGHDAVALGMLLISLGVFLHGHYFWSPSHRYYFLSELLKPLGLLGGICAVGWFVARQFVLG